MTKTARALCRPWSSTGCALAARPCLASGFLIYDISGQALGRASAVSADVDEPAAVWFNPANLVYLGGVSASAGGVFLTSKSSFSPAGGGAETSSERGNFFLPAMFASGLLTDRVAVGMGAYSTFGIGITWPDDWVGRESAIHASLETLNFNPTVAVKVHPRVSVAAGFDAVRSVVDFTNGLPALIGGDVRLAGGTWGYGFNVAGLYKIYPGPAARGAHLPEPGQARLQTGGRTSARRTRTSRPCCPTRAGPRRSRCPTSSPRA